MLEIWNSETDFSLVTASYLLNLTLSRRKKAKLLQLGHTQLLELEENDLRFP